MLEAEVKLRIDDAEARGLASHLVTLGATASRPLEQSDVYYAHPGRDFASTDEALRLRLDAHGLRITYKGPKLDPPRKTREEIEFGLATDLATAASLLERLGFTAVARVAKTRTEYVLAGPPRAVVSLDRVDGLGTFCEIEVAADDVEEAREGLQTVAQRLSLGGHAPIPESYLELLMSHDRR